MMAKIDLPAPGGIALFYAKPESFGIDATEYIIATAPLSPTNVFRQYQINVAITSAAHDLFNQVMQGRA